MMNECIPIYITDMNVKPSGQIVQRVELMLEVASLNPAREYICGWLIGNYCEFAAFVFSTSHHLNIILRFLLV